MNIRKYIWGKDHMETLKIESDFGSIIFDEIRLQLALELLVTSSHVIVYEKKFYEEGNI